MELIGKKFEVHGVEYVIVTQEDKLGKKFRVSPVSNPLQSEVLPKEMVENLIEQEQQKGTSLLDKLNMCTGGVARTISSKILLEVTEEEFEFIKTWVEVGMKYEEIKNK